MCLEPTTATLLALGASAAGAGVNAYEKNKQQQAAVKARNAATQAELARQRQHQANSSLEFDSAVNLFEPEAQTENLEKAQTGAQESFAANAPTAEMVGSISTGNAPRVVGEAEDRSTGKSLARNASFGDALAKLSGYDRNQLDNRFGLNKAGRNVDLIGNFARTSAGVNGLEQQVDYQNAFNANAPSGIGDLLQFAGTVAGLGAGGGIPGLDLFGKAPMSILPTAAKAGGSIAALPAAMPFRGIY